MNIMQPTQHIRRKIVQTGSVALFGVVTVIILGPLQIYAWVLMPNHFHVLCKTKNLFLASSVMSCL